ncbi:MAG TPA: histidine phosphatase family protein [Steroidobacteraceae bacterium]|nr:histidine phosphatase family protein [Steroidobacteraceae bacterium]
MLGRRPFLAPIWLTALLVAVVVAVAVLLYQSDATTMIVVVRPGENAPGAAQDSPLASAGVRRAAQLARLFSGTGAPGRIAAIYVTAARRVQQTAAPLAARLGIRPVVVSGEDADELAARALNEHRGAAVMVVTTAAMAPRLVEALSGIKLAPRAADQYDEIDIVSVPALGSAALVRLHY